jgi:hypothetical protein
MSVIVLGPNPLLRIGQQTIIIGRIRSRPQQLLLRPRNIIKVGLPTQIEKSALPVKRHFTRARLVYIERLAPHFDTQHTCSFLRGKLRLTSWREGEEWRIFWRGLSVLV